VIDLIKQYKAIIYVSVLLAGIIYSFYTVKTDAAEAKKKTDGLERVLKETKELNVKVAAVLVQMAKPEFVLRNHLILYGIDTARANLWSTYPVGPVVDTVGTPKRGIPYLDMTGYPMVGVYKIWSNNGPKILDTLWNFKE